MGHLKKITLSSFQKFIIIFFLLTPLTLQTPGEYMKLNFDTAFEYVLKSEGGYVNDPADRGGETNLGVTKKAWMSFLKVKELPINAMKELTKEKVKPFYRSMYWDAVRSDDLPSGIDYVAFDFAVNAGPVQCVKLLQRALGVTDDGIIGQGTLAAIKAADPKKFLESFNAEKEKFYRKIVSNKPEQSKFLKGWISRIHAVGLNSMNMTA